MTLNKRKVEILAGLRGQILRTLRRRGWSIQHLADTTKIQRESIKSLLEVPTSELAADRFLLDRLLQFGRSRLRPWDANTLRLLRMARDFEELYR